GGARQDGHIAMFPEELPYRLIKMFSFIGDTVLDPFLGSGTTSLVAKKLNRNSVGYEINPEFKPFIEKKLGVGQPELSQDIIKFHKQNLHTDFVDEIKKLPYIFKDFHHFDKKIDPKKLQFGSKIDKNSKDREDFYRVKEVISPTKIKLNNDLTIRLLVVKELSQENSKAKEFLQEKTDNQQIYLRYDKLKHDSSNNLFAYVYLKNKTFLNAHLIKNGLALADTTIDYKNKEKFIKLQKQYG